MKSGSLASIDSSREMSITFDGPPLVFSILLRFKLNFEREEQGLSGGSWETFWGDDVTVGDVATVADVVTVAEPLLSASINESTLPFVSSSTTSRDS